MYQEQIRYSPSKESTLHQLQESGVTGNGFCRQQVDTALHLHDSDNDTTHTIDYMTSTSKIHQHDIDDVNSFQILYAFGLRMHRSLDVEQVLHQALHGLLEVAQAHHGWIVLCTNQTQPVRWLTSNEDVTLALSEVQEILATPLYQHARDEQSILWGQRKRIIDDGNNTSNDVSGDTLIVVPVCSTSDVSAYITLVYEAQYIREPHHERVLTAMVPIIEQALHNASTYQRIVDRDNARESVINRLVHDIRSPLMSTSASIDVIQRVLKQSPMEQSIQDFILESLDSGKRGMQEVINLSKDMLDIKKMQADLHQLDYEEVLLEFVFDEVHKLLYGLAVQKKVIMRYKVEPRALKVLADMRLLQRAIVNLAANALRFSPEGGTITLKAYHAAGSADVMLVVEDMGAGVAQADRERIFMPFAQAQGASSAQGSGIGLAFCREVALAHGGRIWVEERDGGGSRFCLQLPLLPSDPRATTFG